MRPTNFQPGTLRRARAVTAVMTVAALAAGGGLAAAASSSPDGDTGGVAALAAPVGLATVTTPDDESTDASAEGSTDGDLTTGRSTGGDQTTDDDRAATRAERLRAALLELLQPLIDDATITSEQADAVVDALLADDTTLSLPGGRQGGPFGEADGPGDRGPRGPQRSDRRGESFPAPPTAAAQGDTSAATTTTTDASATTSEPAG